MGHSTRTALQHRYAQPPHHDEAYRTDLSEFKFVPPLPCSGAIIHWLVDNYVLNGTHDIRPHPFGLPTPPQSTIQRPWISEWTWATVKAIVGLTIRLTFFMS
jgi:hypothetical protein